jgi:putative phosphoribosyl transferase
MTVFENRRDAGRRLAAELARLRLENPVVLALPRGGVPVGHEIASALGAPLDVMVVRKLGMPYQPELAIGAIASGGVRILNERLAAAVEDTVIEAIAARETAELQRREQRYRGKRPFPDLRHRDVVLVDDGLATGSTMRAAIEAVLARRPGKVIVAVPVGSRDTVEAIAPKVHRVVCLEMPHNFYAVGQAYLDFGQVGDEEVRSLLTDAAERRERK